MNEIKTDYNYQITTDNRSINKTFFKNRIKQAYKIGLDDGFIEKRKLIKYLEDKIKEHQTLINNTELEEVQIMELVKM